MEENEKPQVKPRLRFYLKVPLEEAFFQSEIELADIQWTLYCGPSPSHPYRQIGISTNQIEEGTLIHVQLEVALPAYLPNRMIFWNVLDSQRNLFCIPLGPRRAPKSSPPQQAILRPRVIGLKLGPPRESFIRISVNKKIWRPWNYAFPFSDLVLRAENKEVYVNRNIMCSVSTYFSYMMSNSRLTVMKNYQVLYVKGISFEDLYDILGYVYHGWQFDVVRAQHLAAVAEKFGIKMKVKSSYFTSFEERVSAPYVSPAIMETSRTSSPKSKRAVFESEKDRIRRDEEERNYSFEGFSREATPFYSRSALQEHSHEDQDGVESNESESASPSSSRSDISQDHLTELLDPSGYSTPAQMCPVYLANGFHKFTFYFDSNRFDRIGRMSVENCYGSWEFYFYKKSLNNQDYLAFGLFGTRFDCKKIKELEVRVKFDGVNKIPKMKRILRVMTEYRNAMGCPNFMRWTDVQNYANRHGYVTINVQFLLRDHAVQHPVVNLEQFPGQRDLLVEVEGIRFPVSKDVLSEASPVFKKLFNHSYLPILKKVYEIENISFEHFVILLDFIYNRASKLQHSQYRDMMAHAQRFKIDFMVEKIVQEYVRLDGLEEREAYNFYRKFGLETLMDQFYCQKGRVIRDNTKPIV